MPYYVRVGYLKRNKKHTTCKGYYIRRKGKFVVMKWGAITVVGSSGGRYYWQGTRNPQVKIKNCGSIENAKKHVQWKHKMKSDQYWGGYSKLPPGVKIRPAIER
jgi:hypothetical protein